MARRQPRLDSAAADAVQFRPRGAVRRLRAYYLWSRVTTKPVPRRVSVDGHARDRAARRLGAPTRRSCARSRALAPGARLAVVHHTAGTNSYTAAQAAAIVRGIEIYHVKGNGWNDIGYNFLVDRFGTVYEGRGGGIDKNVIGAHSQGFNTGTVGVALIGNYTRATPPKARAGRARQPARLATRRRARRSALDASSTPRAATRSSSSGKSVTLRAISGHRDTGPSECPGNRHLRLLPTLAKRVAQTGLPKLYSPSMTGALGGPVRFQGASQLGAAVDGDGRRPARATVVARAAGRGTTVDWTWSSPVAGKGPFHVDDRRAGRAARDRHDRRAAGRCRRRRRAVAHEPAATPRRAWSRPNADGSR